MKLKVTSLELALLAAKLDGAVWATMISNEPGNADLLTELAELEEDVKTGRFPYPPAPCSANLGRINAPRPVL